MHPKHAACGLIKRTRALKHTFLSLKHTCVPAEYTANDQGAVPGIQAGGQQEGDKGRQMNPSAVPDIQAGRQTNPSTQRAVTGIQAGRQPGPNKGRQRETNESVRQMKVEEPVRRESRDNPRCQEHHWVCRRRFVEHHQRIDRRFNSSVIHVCFTAEAVHRSAPLSSARDSKCEQGQREAATDNEALNEQTGCSQR